MISLSGAVSFILPSDKIKHLSETLSGKLRSELIKSKSHFTTNCAVVIFDEDLQGCVAEEDGILAVVVGDIYEDDFLQKGKASKAEYLRQLFLHAGVAACVGLNGSYAFLLCDERQRNVYIGTDENSFIPVYYAEHSGVIYFSWDISTILDVMPGQPQINYQNLFTWLLVGGREFGDETRFESVRRLEPGSFLTITEDGFTVSRSDPFYFAPDGSSEATLLKDAAESMCAAVQRRVGRRDRVAIGLSGGLDSRIILAAGVKDYAGEWVCFTYGGVKCIDRDIARDVAHYFGLQHVPIVLGDLMYIDYARDGVFYSGGASLFKHGIQPHLYATLKSKYQAQGLLEAPAVGTIIGSHFAPDEINGLNDRSELLQLYRDHIFNLTQERFISLFQKPQQAHEFYNGTLETLDRCLKAIPGDHLADINTAFTFEARLKRWYNLNLIYPLCSHRPLMPPYDHDFLRVVARIPLELRKDGRFRIKLLTQLDPGSAEFPYNAWMQPAWLLPPYNRPFQKIQEEIEEAQQQVWFDSGKTVYLPSNRWEANFLEWFRVYPQYREFLNEMLISKDAVLCDLLLERGAVQRLIDDHIEGRATNHKILIMLVSAELMCRMFLRGETGFNRQFVDFSKYFAE
jgi:hypothetical protein